MPSWIGLYIMPFGSRRVKSTCVNTAPSTGCNYRWYPSADRGYQNREWVVRSDAPYWTHSCGIINRQVVYAIHLEEVSNNRLENGKVKKGFNPSECFEIY